MNAKKDPMKFWEHEFGKSEVGHDFSGKKILKCAYGQTGSAYGWDIDEIQSGKDEDYGNQQITAIDTNREKADKTSFDIGGKDYQVQKRTTAIKSGSHIVGSGGHDASKKYVIVTRDK